MPQNDAGVMVILLRGCLLLSLVLMMVMVLVLMLMRVLSWY